MKPVTQLIFSLNKWKSLRDEGLSKWTNRELDNAKDGIIGTTKEGVVCYIQKRFE